MSNEYQTTPADFYEQDGTYQERLDTIYRIAQDVDLLIMGISEKESHLANSESFEDTLQRIALTAHRMQLNKISECVLDSSESENYDPSIDIDNPRLLTRELRDLFDSQIFTLNEEAIIEAVTFGEQLGMDDFLTLIGTSHAQDLRSIEFSPWTRKILQNKYGFSDCKDGSSWFACKTRLSNIFVVYRYPPGSNEPERFIRLNCREDPIVTPQPSPQ